VSAPAHPLFEQPWPEGEFRFFQLGHVVDDIIGAARRWTEVFGIGPFHVLPVVEQHANYGDELRVVKIQVGVAQAGPVQIELIQQHCDTPSIFSDWSRRGTSAIHQLATVTEDYDNKKAHYLSLGFDLVAESLTHMRVAYIDTVAEFGFYTEVVEGSANFLTQLAAVSNTCATWDGTDPVRLLTRDGYRVPEDDS
jgi:hypothetical protein